MYKSFRVKNFRCFKDLQINDLGRVNLIAGKNNTGKTALMEAFSVLSSPLSPQMLYGLQDARGIKNSNKYRRESWLHFFSRFDSSIPIELEGIGTDSLDLHREVSLSEIPNHEDSAKHFGQYYMRAKELGLIGDAPLSLQGTSLLQLSFSQPSVSDETTDVYIPSNAALPDYSHIAFEQQSLFIAARSEPHGDWVAEQFTKIDRNSDLKRLVSYLEEFEAGLTDLRLQLLAGNILVSGQVGALQIPLKLMGDGFNRFFYFAITMLSHKPQYFLIDEIENGIHHSVQKKVWTAIGQVARDLDIQVFATTHSLEMIRAAYEAFKEDGALEDLRLHRLDRDEDTDDIEAVTYNRRGLEALATFDFDFEVRG